MHTSSLQSYLSRIQASLTSGQATEHTYRPELRDLFVELTGLKVYNEPKGSEYGKPDFIFIHGENIPVAYGEAKDMHISLEKVEKSEQLGRYFGYARLILTNGIEFRFYKNGVRYGEPIALATKSGNTIALHPERFGAFADALIGFLGEHVDTIRSASHLAQIMGGKARRIRDNLREMLSDEAKQMGKYTDLFKLYDTFKNEILHDITYESFADLYAQTLVYGLFVARYHDKTIKDFSRMEARELVPKSNPLLRRFFDHIAGEAYEKRLEYIVDELCEVFLAADVHALMHGLYQKADIETHDPVIHFYEDFLREYNPALRMERGVFYTPAPVVRFIVRAVDEVLKNHFGLLKGLADTSKIEHEFLLQEHDRKGNRKTEKRQIHRVQILDPATGTGTFLNEVIRHIHTSMAGQSGMWPSYVQKDLLPRIYGFELMMASYTIAHLKLGLTLAESGVDELESRLQIFLTNSLEEARADHEIQGTLFGLAESITLEGMQADEVKRDKPIMVVMGNPPYSGISTNTGEWITKKIEDYKYVDGVHFGERKHWLQDDYVKFFRLAESFIEKNNDGVMAFITNHGYLDNPTFRGMRWHLLQTFDHIYIVDLHGNSKKKETAEDGSKDENVFDIQQGTAIFIGVKTGKKKEGELAKMSHIDLYGRRKEKYDWLERNDFSGAENLAPVAPYYFFVPKDMANDEEYQRGFSVGELFPVNVTGIVTMGDDFIVTQNREELINRLVKLIEGGQSQVDFSSEYALGKNYAEWIFESIKKGKIKEFDKSKIIKFSYRPFDTRYTYLDENFIWRTRGKVTKHMIKKENLSLIIPRQAITDSWSHVQIIRSISDNRIHYSNKGISLQCPLYLYSDSLDGSTRTPNLDPVIWAKINETVGETTPEQVLDYIYAVLHSPSYRDKYKEFLKIDFPRVPYPTSREQFLSLVVLGGELRSLHLLESPKVEQYITTFPIAGSNIVENVKYVNGQVYINADQYFGDVPEIAWTHPIGGYMPAQKWLKDRKGRTLTWEDIAHYQSMIVALSETARVMEEVDRVLIS